MAKKIRINPLDRLVGWLSPRKGLERVRYRMAFDSMRHWDAGGVEFPNDNWAPLNKTPEETDASYRSRIRARARDLERNNEIAQAAIKTIVRNVVGTGIKPQAQVKKANGELDEDLNNRLEELWNQWRKPGVCDLEGHSSFYDLQSMVLRRRIVDGEILVMLPLQRGPTGNPLRVQLWEPDYLTNLAYSAGKENAIQGGVEVDKYGRPVAYHFQIDATGRTQRVPAWQVMHLYNKFRPRQTRGISEFAHTMMAIKDLGEYMEAELVAARVAACFAGFVKTDYAAGRIGRMSTNDDGKRIEEIHPGAIEYLGPNEEISFAQPGRPNTDAAQFSTAQTRRIAAGLGLSFETLSRDYSQGSYSSARQGHLEDRKEYRALQQYLVEHFCQPIWEEFVRLSIYKGLVQVPDFDMNRDRYTAAAWIAPGWEWIDPKKEVDAVQVELENGMTSLSTVCAQRGKDWQEVLKQRKREQDYASQLGVLLGSEPKTGPSQSEGGGEQE
jgi:lambda family phage portal protein